MTQQHSGHNKASSSAERLEEEQVEEDADGESPVTAEAQHRGLSYQRASVPGYTAQRRKGRPETQVTDLETEVIKFKQRLKGAFITVLWC